MSVRLFFVLGLSVVLFGNARAGDFAIVINEINYHPVPAAGMDPAQLKWVELYNRSGQAVNVGGWAFTEGISFTIPAPTVIPSRDFLVVCRDLGAFRTVWGDVPAVGDFTLNLAKGGERLTLVNRDGLMVDSVFYADRSPWPREPDGFGATLELKDPERRNDGPSRWSASFVVGGTPGCPNSTLVEEFSLIPPGATWRFWRGDAPPTGALGEWTGLNYNDDAWEQGESPFGFGGGEFFRTSLEGMEDTYTTVFTRIRFEVEDRDAVSELILTVDYDDGFVAFLNGEEVARMFMDGAGVPSYRATAAAEPHYGNNDDPTRESGIPIIWPLELDRLRAGANVLAVVAANEAIGDGDFVIAATLTARRPPRFQPPPSLVINEVGAAEGEVWVELRNGAGQPMSLADYVLAADQARLAGGALDGSVAPGDYTVFTFQDLPLSGTMILARASDLELVSSLRYAVTFGESCGIWDEGDTRVGPLREPTPGAPNARPSLPAIRITEINYNPESRALRDEFVELYNAGDRPVDLGDWRFSEGIAYIFPAGTVLGQGEYLIVVPDAEYAATKYPGAVIFGDSVGRLSNKGERICLENARGTAVVDFRFADDGSWPAGADGPPGADDPNDPYDGGSRGMTLELRHPDLNPASGGAWVAETVGGTPGGPRADPEPDPPPVVYDLRFEPLLPRPGQSVRFSAEVSCPAAVDRVELKWQYDQGGQWKTLPLADDGFAGDGDPGDGLWGGFLASLDQVGTVLFHLDAHSENGAQVLWPPGAPETFFLMRVDERRFPDSAGSDFYYMIMRRGDLLEGGDSLRRRSTGSYLQLPCAVVADGRVYQYGTVRYRGNTARRHWPRSYRIELTHDETNPQGKFLYLHGMRPYNQFVGMSTFERAGSIAPRTEFVSLAMGDGFWPAYLAMERIDDSFFEFHVPNDAAGNAYRGERDGRGSDLDYLGDDQNRYSGYHKVTNEETSDWSDIIDLCRALNAGEETYLEEIDEILDVEQWVRYFGVHTVISNQENSIFHGNSGDDYFLYRRERDGKFLLLPWDMDTVFTDWSQRLFRPELTSIVRFLHHPAIAPRYWSHLEQMLNRSFSAAAVERMLEEIGMSASGRFVRSMADFRRQRAEFIRQRMPLELTACGEFSEGIVALDDPVPQGSQWRYFKGTADPSAGLLWTELGFDDAAWESGRAGFGYGDNDDATLLNDMQDNYTTVYLRREFTLDSSDDLAHCELWIDYDDGYAAYLNGTPVARSETLDDAPEILSFESTTNVSHEAGNAERVNLAPFVNLVDEGENVVAVVGVNRSADSSDFSLHPAIVVKNAGEDRVSAGCGSPIFAPVGARVALSGFAPVTMTSSVDVNGETVNYDVETGMWATNLMQRADAYEITARTYDGAPVASITVDVVSGGLTQVAGEIAVDRTLTAAEGPYLLLNTTVRQGSVVTVEAGARLLVSDTLTVRGELRIEGTAALPVEVRRAELDDDPIITVSGGTAVLQHVAFDGGTPLRGVDDWTAACRLNAGELTLENCTFTAISFYCLAASGGFLKASDCTFSDAGGGVLLSDAAGEIATSTFQDLGPLDGIRTRSGGALSVDACEFRRLGRGGIDATGPTHIAGCRFIDVEESAVILEGPVESTVVLTLVARSGTGIVVRSGATALLDHVTLVESERALVVASQGAGSAAAVENSIVWDNVSAFSRQGAAPLEVVFSVVQDTAFAGGSGNLVVDPRFADPAQEDWRLAEDSPARGKARDGTDLGAFPSGEPTLLLGDLNEDSRVNVADAVYLLVYMFLDGAPPWCMALADMNGDERMNVADAVYLLGYLFLNGPAPLPPQEPCP